MLENRLPTIRVDLPDSRRLRVSFFVLWFVDMSTAAVLLLLPVGTELNPVTVFFYTHFGLLGVVLAACCYALVVLTVANLLVHPLDLVFLGGFVVLYFVFVFNNVMLIAFDQPLSGLSSAASAVGHGF